MDDAAQTLYGWYVEKWNRDDEIIRRDGIDDDSLRREEQPVSKDEFVRRLHFPSHNPRVKQMWISSFTCTHEAELVSMDESVQRFVIDCENNPPAFLSLATPLRDAS
jgi:hypothetical protein